MEMEQEPSDCLSQRKRSPTHIKTRGKYAFYQTFMIDFETL